MYVLHGHIILSCVAPFLIFTMAAINILNETVREALVQQGSFYSLRRMIYIMSIKIILYLGIAKLTDYFIIYGSNNLATTQVILFNRLHRLILHAKHLTFSILIESNLLQTALLILIIRSR